MGLYQKTEWGWGFGSSYTQMPETCETLLLCLSPAAGGIHIIHIGMYTQIFILTSKRGKQDRIFDAVCVNTEHVCSCWSVWPAVYRYCVCVFVYVPTGNTFLASCWTWGHEAVRQ